MLVAQPPEDAEVKLGGCRAPGHVFFERQNKRFVSRQEKR
jgi:hypothetical protein